MRVVFSSRNPISPEHYLKASESCAVKWCPLLEKWIIVINEARPLVLPFLQIKSAVGLHTEKRLTTLLCLDL